MIKISLGRFDAPRRGVLSRLMEFLRRDRPPATTRVPARSFPLDAEETIIGQSDDLAGIHAHIDLGPYDDVGLISVVHVRVMRDHDRFFVQGEPGSWGATLNGKPLPEGQRTPIRDGDTITLAGFLTLVFDAAGGSMQLLAR